MVSINTNLQSLIVQNNLTSSTNALNRAIEHMTTGFKINHASDNAANFSISENMSSQISSYSVAQDNIAAGMDLVATAQDTISLMQSHGQRIHELITQAKNGTYGANSLNAINSEINARIAEINRLYETTEYNGINLFEGMVYPDFVNDLKAELAPKYNGFIKNAETHSQSEAEALTNVSEVDSFASGQKYEIGNLADLKHLEV